MPCTLVHICECHQLHERLTDVLNFSHRALNIHSNARGFVVGAGAILGICAGLLWTAQGSLMLAYPTEIQKGRYISIFWAIFNLGGVVGASVSLGTNYNSKVRPPGIRGFTCIDLIYCRPTQVRLSVRNIGCAILNISTSSWKWDICQSNLPLYRVSED